MPGPRKQQAKGNAWKEKPLSTFVPTSYMALLEGTLLTNGDIRGSWRARREDDVSQDFCMVLVDRGVYDGGFNLQVPKSSPSAPFVQEIHDRWESFEWVETTKSCCNVWGQGRNTRFGEYFMAGVHDPRQKRIVLYKVCESELRRAQDFAQSTKVPTGPLTTPALPEAPKASAAAASPTSGGRQKRPRTASPREVAAAAALLYQQAFTKSAGAGSSGGGGGGGSSSSNGSGSGDRRYTAAEAFSASSDGDAGGGGGGGIGSGSESCMINVEGNLGSSNPVPTPTEVRTLPGFSGRYDDAMSLGFVDDGVDELADLSILVARLQRERIKIQEHSRAQRQPFVEHKKELQSKLQKAKADESMMLRAVQELRKQMLEDERQLESATQLVKSYEAEEQHALLLWNNKWETQVAPFIAQCEQGVKRKASELEKKSREAEKERLGLEREKARLQSVKQIGHVFLPNLSI